MNQMTMTLRERAQRAVPPSARARLWQGLFALFAIGVLALIASRATEVEWSRVGESLRAYGIGTLLAAALLSLAGHAAAGSYDLIGRRYLKHRMPVRQVFPINVVAYAFSLNLGAMIGGWAFRLRLYTRYGLKPRAVAQIIALAIVTNWSGFVLIAGLVLLLQPPPLPAGYETGTAAMRAVGVLLLGVVIAYVGACAAGYRRKWSLKVRGVDLRLPAPSLAFVQIGVSTASWLLMACALALLLPSDVPFARVVSALFVSSIAGAAFHVPGGLGVLEAGVTQMLADLVAEPEVLAAVLAFRAFYYLIPFALAGAAYAAMEYAARRRIGRFHGQTA
jgi:uncharacterized membrane protein YbhN (UPF0104 family)